ncbi:MAG: hypothetical protein NDJ89_17185 [Oligoflexia bacterium]|nr:hypothetical protein [Oligoflexia bacterium]
MIDFRVAEASDEADLRRLLRENPMPGSVCLSLEREPDFFAAQDLEGDRHTTVIARDSETGRAVGMGSRSVATAWINGEKKRLGYLSQLRVDQALKGQPSAVTRAYTKMEELHRGGAETPFYLTTIIEENASARKFLTSPRLRRMPVYREREAFSTLAIPVWRKKREPGFTRWEIRRAEASELEAISSCLERNYRSFQFAPSLSAAELADPSRSPGLSASDFLVAIQAGQVAGCVSVWDQQAFKQTVVRGYSRSIRLARAALNALGPWLGVPRLPRAGQRLPHAALSHLAVDHCNEDLLVALLTAAFNASVGQGYSYLTLGLAARHPLLAAVRSEFRPREYRSILCTVHWPDGERAVAALDDRIPHLEVARL